ncbi:DUF6659 family protein [Nitrosopumilus sp.]|uniref:DUF6659 family protein n=1 Tax=Nitrosopumilus sp. TaxID=2024843 RepID=UPI00292FAD5F|nr:DUF6659 family protein [Nitrosopumilus sp.]
MTVLHSSNLNRLEEECNTILENDKIKFVGVINSLGNLIAGGFRKGIVQVVTDEVQKMMYMQLKLDLNMRKEYDELFGSVNYVVSNRKNADKISIPIGTYMILVITETNFDHELTIKKITSTFKPILDNYT